MSVPDRRDIPRKLYDTGLFNLKTEDGQGAFTDAVVAALHASDERWGHLKKHDGQSQLHHHGEDSALYLSEEPGQSQAVDFIGGAGGSNPQPGWIVDDPRYSRKDWLDPFDHGYGAPPVPPPPTKPIYPSYEELGGDEGAKKITRVLEADYKRAGRAGLDGDCGGWLRRTDYDVLTGKIATVEESIAVHRHEWCAALGIPVQ